MAERSDAACGLRLARFEPWYAASAVPEGMIACCVVAAPAAAMMEVAVTCSAADGRGRPLGSCTLAEVQAARLGLERGSFRAALAALPGACRPRGAGGAARLWQELHALLAGQRGAFTRAFLGERAYARYALEGVLCWRRGRQEGTYWIGLDGGDAGSGREFVLRPGPGGAMVLADSQQQEAFAALLAAAGRAAGYAYAPDEAQAFLQSLLARSPAAPAAGGGGGDGAAAALPAGIGCAFAGMIACGRGVYPYLQLSWDGGDGAQRVLPLRLACRPLAAAEGAGDDLQAWVRLARRNGPRYFAAELPRRAALSCSRWQLFCAGADAAQLPLLLALALQHLTARSERYRVMFASSDPARIRAAAPAPAAASAAGGG